VSDRKCRRSQTVAGKEKFAIATIFLRAADDAGVALPAFTCATAHRSSKLLRIAPFASDRRHTADRRHS
jgi:hypothetical protein